MWLTHHCIRLRMEFVLEKRLACLKARLPVPVLQTAGPKSPLKLPCCQNDCSSANAMPHTPRMHASCARGVPDWLGRPPTTCMLHVQHRL